MRGKGRGTERETRGRRKGRGEKIEGVRGTWEKIKVDGMKGRRDRIKEGMRGRKKRIKEGIIIRRGRI